MSGSEEDQEHVPTFDASEGDEDEEESFTEMSDDEEEDISEEDAEVSLGAILRQVMGARMARQQRPHSRFPRLSDVVQLPLESPALLQDVLMQSSPVNKRRCVAPSLDAGQDPSNLRVRLHGPQLQQQPEPDPCQLEQSGPRHSITRMPSRRTSSSIPSSASTLPVTPGSPDNMATASGSSVDGHVHTQPSATTVAANKSKPATGSGVGGRRRRSSRLAEEGEGEPSCDPGQQQCNTGGSSRMSIDEGAGSGQSVGGWRLGPLLRSWSKGGRRSSGEASAGGETHNAAQPSHVSAEARPPVTRREDAPWSGVTRVNSVRLLTKRELGLGDTTQFNRQQRVYLQLQPSALPTKPVMRVEQHHARCYIGQFSKDGAYYVVGCQDTRVRVYEVQHQRPWSLKKDVRPRNVRWTVTDTCTSPDQQFLIYCSIHPTVHMVKIAGSSDTVTSRANIDEVHEALYFDESNQERFGIWSVRWSKTGNEIIAGTNNESVYVYDIGEQKVVARGRGHQDDVNAVEYLDESPHHILTGSDDNLIKLWDRRMLDSHGRRRAVGVLVGHTEGLTHLNAKGDGHCFISNCKDQTIKMWDVRQGLRSENEVAQLDGRVASFSWDYRWMEYPGAGLDIRHPHDASVMTYRGHAVHQTLIRAYFSPSLTTGQRLIYSGSADNCIHLWDVVTGYEVGLLEGHRQLVRDVSWHPTEPLIVSVSWDGDVIAWAPSEAGWRSCGPVITGRRATETARRGGWS